MWSQVPFAILLLLSIRLIASTSLLIISFKEIIYKYEYISTYVIFFLNSKDYSRAFPTSHVLVSDFRPQDLQFKLKINIIFRYQNLCWEKVLIRFYFFLTIQFPMDHGDNE